ncbi:MAG: prepilin peptidase [Candidatus Liptonbacteria bacterium]|nr:prepilin peptidase [Candidatus Liptonbacteria bacterium]
MTFATGIVLFAFGLVVGSFINVVSLRYDPARFLFSRHAIGLGARGERRSYCPHCRKTLRWFELIPLVSFFLQRGRCRSCRARLSIQYPIVEVLSGLIFVFVPLRIVSLYYLLPATYYLLCGAWIFALLTLLLIAAIDIRLRIIPDEGNVLLILVGIAVAALTPSMDVVGGSLLQSYGMLLFASSHIWLNKLFGFLAGGLGLLALLVVTRGRGMGLGDVKLAAALGALFGWPDIMVLLGLSFVLGAVAGILGMAMGGKTMKSALPFGPFIALAATFVFFMGFEFVGWYLKAALSFSL